MERTSSLALGAILLLAFGVRMVGIDQPIVENYVGRQIPTAMVARNLERGSGFLHPVLDVAPSPNSFLIEPPLYAGAAVLVKRATGLELSASGRIVSALGIMLGGWGLFGLVLRREGVRIALLAVAVFVCVPVTVRYGRAFQPDALMIGCILAGMRGWDEYESGDGTIWVAFGCLALAAGLALKIVSAYVFVPIAFGLIRDRRPWKFMLLFATLTPGLLWYFHAASVVSDRTGSRAMADNGAIWLDVFRSNAWMKSETYANVVRFLGIRAFTPIGPLLAIFGLVRLRTDRLWLIWGASVLAAMALLGAKLHHEYYWLALAPVVSVGIARGLDRFRDAVGSFVTWNRVWGSNSLPPCGGGPGWGVGTCPVPQSKPVISPGPTPHPNPPPQGGREPDFCVKTLRKTAQIALASLFIGLCILFSASTFRTPSEWKTLQTAAKQIQEYVPKNALVVAPEALLFQADRRGCRIEYSNVAARRAAGEWNDPAASSVHDPADLVRFYQLQGARFFADVVPELSDPRRLALHEAVRRRYNVVSDSAGVLIVSLTEPNEAVAHGQVSRDP